MQQWKKTQEVRALKEMAVSTTPTTIANTSISNGLGILEFLSEKTYFITGATGFLAKGMALSSAGCFFVIIMGVWTSLRALQIIS